MESKLTSWEMAAMLSRDFFLCLYGLLMVASGKWKSIIFRAIRWGKATTALQFAVLIGLVLGLNFPVVIFLVFIGMGCLGFLELLQTRPSIA